MYLPINAKGSGDIRKCNSTSIWIRLVDTTYGYLILGVSPDADSLMYCSTQHCARYLIGYLRVFCMMRGAPKLYYVVQYISGMGLSTQK